MRMTARIRISLIPEVFTEFARDILTEKMYQEPNAIERCEMILGGTVALSLLYI
jgi:hypothetical protein